MKTGRAKWVSKDGRETYIDEMSDRHLENTIKMINKKHKSTPLLTYLRIESYRRGVNVAQIPEIFKVFEELGT